MYLSSKTMLVLILAMFSRLPSVIHCTTFLQLLACLPSLFSPYTCTQLFLSLALAIFLLFVGVQFIVQVVCGVLQNIRSRIRILFSPYIKYEQRRNKNVLYEVHSRLWKHVFGNNRIVDITFTIIGVYKNLYDLPTSATLFRGLDRY